MSLLLFWQVAGPPVTGTATFAQAPATWDAAAFERFPSTATFDQSATWAASSGLRFTGVTAFDQAPAEWLAVALSLPNLLPVPLSASFTQDTATVTGTAIQWVVVLVWE